MSLILHTFLSPKLILLHIRSFLKIFLHFSLSVKRTVVRCVEDAEMFRHQDLMLRLLVHHHVHPAESVAIDRRVRDRRVERAEVEGCGSSLTRVHSVMGHGLLLLLMLLLVMRHNRVLSEV